MDAKLGVEKEKHSIGSYNLFLTSASVLVRR